MDEAVWDIGYLIASILFIMGLKKLGHPRTAPTGNLYGALGMLVAVVVTIIGALRTDSFDMTQVMTEGGPGRGSSDVMSTYMYQKTLFDQDYGYGSTIAVLLFSFMLLFIIAFIIRMYHQDEKY